MTQPAPVESVGAVGSVELLVATARKYPALAPVTALQLKKGVVETLVAPFNGALRVGAGRF